ncbi:MAG: ribonuclease P protein component 1 [Candidatus Aenigmarchaeota archaeon]|nr:ribonuclease P protein component 1 [Candidatus Aenigmarchaeota archaeon]NIP41019.1 ribonuclease P protein component 1 [Candidatus Aenigmarchaeota archaeon]NIQ17421.1 ribonuclease P protein component 1 [Candidatus Aenigmarchaeota archaeon]NIS73615.1 ribonuclease P protein component 1 [Candidatus Aenigmarchaeota archaeon]
MRTPENLVRHELIGLKVKIVESSNKKNIGISGRVVDETRNIMVIEKTKGKEVRLSKEHNVFVFVLNRQKVRIDGKILVGRPEDRIKKKFRKW